VELLYWALQNVILCTNIVFYPYVDIHTELCKASYADTWLVCTCICYLLIVVQHT